MTTGIAEPRVIATVLSTKGDKTYEIRMGKDGKTYCSCPAWKYGRGTGCKHLRIFYAGVAKAVA